MDVLELIEEVRLRAPVEQLKQLVEACLSQNPEARPTFKELQPLLGAAQAACKLAHYESNINQICDEAGKRFWRKNFFQHEKVSWASFETSFFKSSPQERKETELGGVTCYSNTPTSQLLLWVKHIVCPNHSEIVTLQAFCDLVGWFGPLVGGLENRVRHVMSAPFFHGRISQDDAEHTLCQFFHRVPLSLPYLLRFSGSTYGGFVLSYLSEPEGGLKHHRFWYSPGEGFSLNGVIHTSFYELEVAAREAYGLTHRCPSPDLN